MSPLFTDVQCVSQIGQTGYECALKRSSQRFVAHFTEELVRLKIPQEKVSLIASFLFGNREWRVART